MDDYYISDDIEKSTKERKCHSSAEYLREWRKKNAEHVREYERKHYEEHKEEKDAYHKEWVADNWLRVKLYNQKYRDLHREDIRKRNRERYWKKKAEDT